MILEVCVDSFKSLLTAKEAGADRIELCSALNIGGLTPSYGLMKQAKDITNMEIFIMIRPRSGDFLYDDVEYETMKKDIEVVKEIGFDGIVTGMLLENGNIDLKRMKEVVELAKPLKVVLHRAFDDAKEPEKDIPALIDMGFERILTSGQRENALEGVEYIADIQRNYGQKITIMPGAGINAENIEEIYNRTGCTHYHMSGKVDVGSKMKYRECHKRKNSSLEEFIVESADFNKINTVRDILDRLGKS